MTKVMQQVSVRSILLPRLNALSTEVYANDFHGPMTVSSLHGTLASYKFVSYEQFDNLNPCLNV